METGVAILCEGSNVSCVSPELTHWDDIETCFLLLNAFWSCNCFQHPPGSSSNTNPNQTISYLFVVAFLWQCFCSVALLVQPPRLPCLLSQVGTAPRASLRPVWVGGGEVGKQIKRPVRATDLLLTVFHIWGIINQAFVLPLFFFWWNEVQKKRPLLATSLGQLVAFSLSSLLQG